MAASDPNFKANPYMFTGRRFDYETGLYYYRARYYNPYIGRFLQTDPVGYGDGINWYLYCLNNPLKWIDPTGSTPVGFHDVNDWSYVLNLENSSVTAISGEWNLEGLSTTFEVAPWEMYTISDSCDLSLKPLYPEDHSWWSSMGDSVVGTSSIVDSFDDVLISPWSPRHIPNPNPDPTPLPRFVPDPVERDPRPTRQQEQQTENLRREGEGSSGPFIQEPKGFWAKLFDILLLPPSGGGGRTYIVVPRLLLPPPYGIQLICTCPNLDCPTHGIGG